jgi:hypothetical protein
MIWMIGRQVPFMLLWWIFIPVFSTAVARRHCKTEFSVFNLFPYFIVLWRVTPYIQLGVMFVFHPHWSISWSRYIHPIYLMFILIINRTWGDSWHPMFQILCPFFVAYVVLNNQSKSDVPCNISQHASSFFFFLRCDVVSYPPNP